MRKEDDQRTKEIYESKRRNESRFGVFLMVTGLLYLTFAPVSPEWLKHVTAGLWVSLGGVMFRRETMTIWVNDIVGVLSKAAGYIIGKLKGQ